MNKEYKHLRALLSIITNKRLQDENLSLAMKENATPVTRSKLQGWRRGSNNRHFVRMTQDDFNNVLTALIKYYGEKHET